MLSNKQSVEEVLIQRAVKKTIQILYDKGLFDEHDNADDVLKSYLHIEVNQRRRRNLHEVNDVFQGFYSYVRFEKKSKIKYKNS